MEVLISCVCVCVRVCACVCVVHAATNPGIDVKALELQIMNHIEHMHVQMARMGAMPPLIPGNALCCVCLVQ